MKRIKMISLAAALVPVSAAAHPGAAPQPQMHVRVPAPGAHAPTARPHHGPVRFGMRRTPGGNQHFERRIIRHHGINAFPGYRRFDRGFILPQSWWGPQYHIGNWGMYGLPQPMHGGRWVRYYDDALLIDGNGRVHDGRWGMKWDEWDREWAYDDRGVPVYVGNGDFHPGAEDYAVVEGQGGAYANGYGHHGYGHQGYGYGAYGQQGYGYAYPGCACGYGSGMVVTETTVTTAPTVVAETVYEDVVVETHRYRAKPRPRVKARPRPAPVLPGERG